MTTQHTLYEDEYGAIVAPESGAHVEIRWTEATLGMSGDAFNAWLERFAGLIEERRCRTALVDARLFRMERGQVDMGWRDTHIIPRYNAAGLQRFAFVMPPGMPAIGAPPAPEGPADFPTAFFGDYPTAMQWLGEI